MSNENEIEIVSDAEAASEFAGDGGPKASSGAPPAGEVEREASDIPEWATLPDGFVIPAGKQVAFFRMRAPLTDAPEKGDRWCMVWTLTEKEERMAIARANGDGQNATGQRLTTEMTRASIRLIDGKRVDWSRATGPQNPWMFFADIGPKYRQVMTSYHLQSHTMTREERADFFANCFVATRAVGT